LVVAAEQGAGMTILGRYLSREIFQATAMVLTGFLGLFGFFDLFEELENIGRGNYRLGDALTRVVLAMPSHIYELMPIAVLIGAIWALAMFAQHAEFTAMRAAGLGRMRALRELLALGFLCVGLTALFGEVLAPPAERLAQSLRLSAMGATLSAEFRSGVWVKDTTRNDAGELERIRFVNVAQVRPDATLSDLRVYEFDPQFRLRAFLLAAQGRYTSDGHWLLTDVVETQLVPKAPARLTNSPETRVEQANRVKTDQKIWNSGLDPSIVSVLLVQPERMSALDLFHYVEHLRDNRQQVSRYEIALWKKIIYPFAALVMLALALPFGYLQTRSGGIALKVFSGIMLGVGFHFLNGLASHLGLLNTWPAWIAALVPSALALALALSLLAWVDRAR
jgi:lipopolysaccharide export system permease protein